VAELTLSPAFSRGHDSLYKGIATFHLPQAGWQSLRAVLLPTVGRHQGLWVWSVDVTGHPRPYARTLEDRQMIYQPTPIAGNRPVNIGHRYSGVFAHPPRRPGEPVWAPPLSIQRMPSKEDPEVTGARQVLALVKEGRAQRSRWCCSAVYGATGCFTAAWNRLRLLGRGGARASVPD